MQTQEDRIAALEAEIEHLRHELASLPRQRPRWRGPAALLVLGLGLGLSASGAGTEAVRTEKLVLVNAEGQRRGELFVDESGAGRLELFGPRRKGRRPEAGDQPFASLSAQRGGGQLDLASTTAGTTATLGSGYGETWGGFLRLASDGYPVVSLWTQDGTANLHMIDSDEEGGVLMGTRSVSSGRAGWLELRNGSGDSSLYLLSGAKGEGVIELYDESGVAHSLEARPRGAAEDPEKPPRKPPEEPPEKNDK